MKIKHFEWISLINVPVYNMRMNPSSGILTMHDSLWLVILFSITLLMSCSQKKVFLKRIVL